MPRAVPAVLLGPCARAFGAAPVTAQARACLCACARAHVCPGVPVPRCRGASVVHVQAALTTQACNDLSDVCTKKPPTLPKKHPKRKMKGTKDKKSKKKGAKSKAKKAAAPKTEL